jgi:hypothetical protein
MLANASIQNTTTLQGLLCAAFGGFPAHVVSLVVSHGWIPAFAGMTHAGLAGRDEVSRTTQGEFRFGLYLSF